MRRAFLVAFAGVLATLSVVASAAANPQGSFTQVAGDWTRSPPADRAACLRLVGANGRSEEHTSALPSPPRRSSDLAAAARLPPLKAPPPKWRAIGLGPRPQIEPLACVSWVPT